MVLRPDVLRDTLASVPREPRRRVIHFSPAAPPLDHAKVVELAAAFNVPPLKLKVAVQLVVPAVAPLEAVVTLRAAIVPLFRLTMPGILLLMLRETSKVLQMSWPVPVIFKTPGLRLATKVIAPLLFKVPLLIFMVALPPVMSAF